MIQLSSCAADSFNIQARFWNFFKVKPLIAKPYEVMIRQEKLLKIRIRLFNSRRRWICSTVAKHQTTQPVAVKRDEPKRLPKMYVTILDDMAKRIKEYRDAANLEEYRNKIDMDEVKETGLPENVAMVKFHDAYRGLKVGDLIESKGHGLSVIITEPAFGEDRMTLFNFKGGLYHVKKVDVAFSLGKLVEYDILKNVTINTTNLAANGETTEDLPVRLRVYLLNQLRSFQFKTSDICVKVKRTLEKVLTYLQQENKSVILPFFELASIVHEATFIKRVPEMNYFRDIVSKQFPPTTNVNNEIPRTVYYLVRTMLEKVFEPRILFSNDNILQGVVILPKDHTISVSEAIKQIISTSDIEKKMDQYIQQLTSGQEPAEGTSNELEKILSLTKLYAIGDFNKNDIRALPSTILLLKSLESINDEAISSEVSMRLQEDLSNINLEDGPFSDKMKFRHIFAKKEELIPARGEKYPDLVESVRQDVGEDRPVYCIDASDAQEIDDGISIDTSEGDIWKVGIHIADPASGLYHEQYAPIINAAFAAASTAYLPHRTIPMLPKSISDDFGLVSTGSSPRRCLTFEFKYDSQSDNIVNDSFHIIPQTLNNIVQMTYDEVDTHLQEKSDSDLHKLYKIASNISSFRQRNGALSFNIPGTRIKVRTDNGPNIEVNQTTEVTKSQTLVTELMISANYNTAVFTKNKSIPNIYRCQSLNFETGNNKLHVSSVEESLATLSGANAAYLSTVPFIHRSIGVSAYTHVTSPLRRFQDLLSHWQIESHLTGGIPKFSDSALRVIAGRLQIQQDLNSQVQRLSHSYWILRKIELIVQDTMESPAFECIVDRRLSHEGPHFIYCTNWGINALVHNLSGAENLAVGHKLSCKLKSINSATNTLVLSVM